MARASEEFQLAWQSLPKEVEKNGWQTIPMTAPSADCSVRAGRRYPGGQESVHIGFESVSIPSAERMPDGQGFFIERLDQNDGWCWLALTRSESGQFDLFLNMVCDVVGLLDQVGHADQQTLLRLFIERVRAWQEFMRKGVTALGHEREVGLIGELLVFNALLDEGLDNSSVVEAWKGPLDAEQDFELGTGAIEAKSTISQAGFPARIGSLKQLDDAVHHPLFVAGVKLRQMPEGVGLAALVSQTKDRLKTTQMMSAKFDRLLLDAGYFESHSSQYTRRFELRELRLLEVTKHFPRLTTGSVPVGVTSVVYSIDLDRFDGACLALGQVLTKLGMKSK